MKCRAASLAAVVLLSSGAVNAQQRGGTLTVGLPYDIDTLNVYTTGTLGDVESAVVEGLLAPDAQAHYVPRLATDVPTLQNGGIELTRDGRAMRVTYHLRPGITWSDGAPLTSADVKFTWEAVSDPKFLAESKDGTKDVESITTPDDLTAVVNYRTVAPAFASTLFTFGILPRHLLLGKDLNHHSYNDRPLGTGPFVVSEFRRGQYVVLDRNPRYWGRDARGEPLPYLDRIIYKVIPNSNTMGTLIRAGEVLLAPRIPLMLAKQLQGTKNIELVRGASLGWVRIDFGLKAAPALRDPAVRRAISQAINRQALVKAAGGYPEPIYSPVLPVLEGLFDPDPEAAVPGYDPAAANRALDEAGYARGSDGYRARDGRPLSFGVTTRSGDVDGEIAEQIIISDLKQVGIRLTADNKTGIAYREARYKGAFDLVYGQIFTAADPVYSVFYGTHGPLNGGGYSNAALDAALERMETSIEAAPRRAASSQMQRLFAADLPSLPLVSNVSIAAKSTRLKNFAINPTNMTDFIGAGEWYLDPVGARSSVSFRFLVRRLLGAVPLLVAISLLLFVIVHLAPGGPMDVYADNPSVTPEALEQIKIAYGLDQPLPVQYLRWLKSMAQGVWGYSFRTGRPVTTEIAERLPATLLLGGTALGMSLLLALPIGVMTAAWKGSRLDHALTFLSLAGISIPVFWLALILQLVFSIKLGWLPAAGYETIGDSGALDRLGHLAMPAVVLAMATVASWSRFLRSSMVDALRQDYIRTAFAKGHGFAGVLIQHALRNALVPVITIISLDLASVISGAVITETVFAWPGIGQLFVESMDGRDYPVLMGLMLMGSVSLILANLAADLIYVLIDPRIRL